MPRDPIALARQLIDIPSVTGEEGPHGAFLQRVLTSLGFTIEEQEIEAGRKNLFATAGGVPRVILCSHLDTVPPFFPSSETPREIHGRGACDTKGIIAAMVDAGEQLIGDGAKDFAFLFVVGEETDSIGAKRANDHFAGRGSEIVIVGEPTDSRYVRATKGALTARIEFPGVPAHSAYPERGDSAIRKLARAIEAIYEADWGSDDDLGQGIPNVGVVRGGEKANVIAAHAEADCIFRLIGPVAAAHAQLETLTAAHGGSIARWYGNDPVRMMVPAGEDSIVAGFNTDAPHLFSLGRPILFGPGSILDAHGESEKIGKSEIIAASETYRKLVLGLLEGTIRL
ncbi:MAG TPA: M20/M25/M40 family metallo-hydrolase [Thermoanaerobaculia bacterium]|nr:M20/M25/M40 family metallo-hydrolase [Thermoanaerobaculia bacterium]